MEGFRLQHLFLTICFLADFQKIACLESNTRCFLLHSKSSAFEFPFQDSLFALPTSIIPHPSSRSSRRIHIHHPPYGSEFWSGLKFFQNFPQAFLERHLGVPRSVQFDHTFKLVLILDACDDALFRTKNDLFCLDGCHLSM